MINIVDARGLPAQEPVLLVIMAMQRNKGAVEVLVDNTYARNNVAKVAEQFGRKVQIIEDRGQYRLILK